MVFFWRSTQRPANKAHFFTVIYPLFQGICWVLRTMPGWTGIAGRWKHRHAGEGSAQQFGDANHRSTWEVGKWQVLEIINSSSWWFPIFCIFIPIWGRFPIWLIFFKGVETTNQSCYFGLRAVVLYLSFLRKEQFLSLYGGLIDLVVKWLFCTLTILLSAVVGSNEVKVEILDTKILWAEKTRTAILQCAVPLL